MGQPTSAQGDTKQYRSNKSPSKVKRTFTNDYNMKINIETDSKLINKSKQNM